MKWNDKAYTAIVEQHPVLEGKSESVAVATWALTQKQDMTPEEMRQLSKDSGVNVRGRAVGSAREILGIKKAAKAAPKRRSARKPGPRRAKRQSVDTGLASLVGAVSGLEKERKAMRKALDQIQEILDGVR